MLGHGEPGSLPRSRDELIAQGHDTLPVPAVERQRQRLVSPRRRRALARTLDGMLGRATAPPRTRARGVRPLFDVRVVATIATELRVVIGLLQIQNARVRGSALTEHLLTNGGSRLYRSDARSLREVLHRVRGALEQ